MRQLIILVLSFAISGLLVFGAQAADLGGDRGSLKDDPLAYSPLKRYYVALRGGLAFPEDTDFDINDGAMNVVNSYEDVAYFISGAVGMRLYETSNVKVRGDLELGYREAEIDTHNVAGTQFSSSESSGDTSVFYGLANLTVDFKTGTRFTPYLSAGGGLANVSFDGHAVDGPGVVMDDDDTAYALQLGAGVNYNFGRGLTFELGYRYFAVYDVDLTAEDGTNSSTDIEDHQILFGIRQTF
ncbi:MAG: outer membrane beta-barrel protein [Pseudomonadota bacterium]